MGSLTSGPDIPSPTSQVVYVPQPLNTAPVKAETPEVANVESEAQGESSKLRKQSLIGRERSRFGTVKTSFRGVLGLSDSGSATQRKTLLGE